MTEKKIIKFPVTHQQRRKKRTGPLKIECIISGRVLAFQPSSDHLTTGNVISFDVLSDHSEGEQPNKICSMTVIKEELLAALERIQPKDGL